MHFRYNKKKLSLLSKLIILSSGLILATTIIVSFTSYYSFSTSYKDEQTNLNKILLKNIEYKINNELIDKISLLAYNSIIYDSNNIDQIYFFDNYIEKNNVKIYKVYKNLQNIVLKYYDIVDCISIYYKKNNMLISSSSGVNFLNHHPSELLYGKNGWIYDYDNNSIIFKRFYPNLPNNNKGYISINLNNKSLDKFISSLVSYKLGNILLLDIDNIIIYKHELESDITKLDKNNIDIITKSKSHNIKSYINNINRKEYIITYVKLNNDWTLISYVPLNLLNEKSKEFKSNLIKISSITLLVNIIISIILSSLIYSPIALAIKKAKKMYHSSFKDNTKVKNEYIYIDKVITSLSNKANQSLSIMKSNFVLQLINNNFDDQSFIKYLNNININLNSFHLGLLIIRLNCENQDSSHYPIQDLIQKLESFNNENNKIIIAELPEYYISAVILSKKKDKKVLYDISHNINNYINNKYNIEIVTSIGNFVDSYSNFHILYNNVKYLFNYSYFKPYKNLLDVEMHIDYENKNNKIPKKLLNDYSNSIKSNDINIVEKSISSIVYTMVSGEYTASHCQRFILELINRFNNYIDNINMNMKDNLNINEYNLLNKTSDIYNFKLWFIHQHSLVFNYMKQKKDSSEIINKIKDYIVNNLDEDLSLNALSKKVYLSSGYLCKVFKDETNYNLKDFINNHRMLKARSLLISTNLHINDIAIKVGFNSPNYFNNKFKQYYGVSPKVYRLNHSID